MLCGCPDDLELVQEIGRGHPAWLRRAGARCEGGVEEFRTPSLRARPGHGPVVEEKVPHAALGGAEPDAR
jgi:hypothetical protein